MPVVRFGVEFVDAFDVPDLVEVSGSTVHAAIDEVGRRWGGRVVEGVLDHAHGRRWRLAPDVEVRVNGRDVTLLSGLGTPLAPGDEIVIAPRKGSAGPLESA